MIEKEQVLWDVCQEMTKNLKVNAIGLNKKTLAGFLGNNRSGIFGVFYVGKELGLSIGKESQPDLIFVDTSGDLERHLFESNTGYSSLRRSLAALLASRYDLQPVPRTSNEQDVDRFDNYSLDQSSEEKLSAWMQENLLVSVIAVPAGEEEKFVQAMVDCNAPVLNLRNNRGNQYGAEIKLCRKKCAERAVNFKAVLV